MRLIDAGETDARSAFFQRYAPDGTPENIVIHNAVVYTADVTGSNSNGMWETGYAIFTGSWSFPCSA